MYVVMLLNNRLTNSTVYLPSNALFFIDVDGGQCANNIVGGVIITRIILKTICTRSN